MGDQLLKHIEDGNQVLARDLIAEGHKVSLEHLLATLPYDGESSWFFKYALRMCKDLSPEKLRRLLNTVADYEKKEAYFIICDVCEKQVREIVNLKYKGYTLIQEATIDHDDERIKKLISLGADVTVIDDDGNTLLHLLCPGGNWMCRCYYPELVGLLIDNGVDRTVKNAFDNTPEDVAYILGHDKHARYIREYGSPIKDDTRS